MFEPKVILSERAYAEIINETVQNIRTETGGILLGTTVGNVWFVLESLDPGPGAILSPAYFEYDDKYVTHLANKVRLRYKSKLRLLGLWHRHPGSLDRFSSTDDGTNRTFVQTCGGAAISGLINLDPDFRMTFYLATADPFKYERIACEPGDRRIPGNLLEMWDSQGLLDQLARVTRTSGSTPVWSLSGHEQRDSTVAAPERNRLLKFVDSLVVGKQQAGNGELSAASQSVDRVELSDKGNQAVALEMISEEIDFLEGQQDYSYEISVNNRGVSLVLTKALELRECPPRLDFLFTKLQDRMVVVWNDEEYPFRPGITGTLVNRALERSAEK